ncbi:hypothetical protein [Rossellomorea aquimaris]|uniref:Uncharacterized protein n=1 Tax=Rossellomorea aquimaris TaxID=189382 RepID=A0A1J6W456_9BACI|nr:hypothetical protein [Rossellomorea aquimaris]OIU72405.1 hypothetical protein BHE18_07205 [Rossellomorea aquimaris]
MPERRDVENRRILDFDEITGHILPAQYSNPLVAISKNKEGQDDFDEVFYVEGKKSIDRNQDENARK